MREEAEDFRQSLLEKYGAAIEYGFIDVDTEEMQKYPEAQAFLDRIRLPFIWINGQPSFHGGFSLDLMSKPWINRSSEFSQGLQRSGWPV